VDAFLGGIGRSGGTSNAQVRALQNGAGISSPSLASREPGNWL